MMMKKMYFALCCILLTIASTDAKAQVTIGSGNQPNTNALLDLKENSDGSSIRGFLLPRVALTALNSPAPMSEHTIGMVVYNTATTGNLTPGFYYNNGSQWVRQESLEPWMISGTTNQGVSNTDNIYQIGNVGVGTQNVLSTFHVDGAKDNTATPTAEQLANDFIVTPSGSVGIGTVTPDASAILDIKASNKGFLGPRVALKSTTDIVTVPNPADGLLVYNIGTGGLNYPGYVYWNGTEWRAFNSASLSPGTIGAITCNAVQLTPSIYKAGVPFEGTMIVPYIGGNGGVYAAQQIGPINGLTATLSSGNFNVGAGNLAYTISGTPTVTTPDVTVFPIEVGGKTCEATIGAGEGIAPGDLVYYRSPAIPANIGSGDRYSGNVANCWINYYDSDLPVIGGKLRIDGYFHDKVSGSGTVCFQPRLVNTSDKNVKFWFSAMSTAENFNSANVVIKPGDWVNLDNGVYNGYGENSTLSKPTTGTNQYWNAGGAQTEVITLDFSLDDKWYRVYYYPIVDNMEQTTAANMKRIVYLSIQRLY